MSEEIRKTNCHYCGYLCAFDAHMDGDKIVELTPDPTRYPYDIRVAQRCRRWRMNLDKLYSKDRVNYPMRAKGKRGSGEFERISWDEAISEISDKLKALVERHGPWTVASAIGGPHAVFWPLHRFMNLLGSPNNMGIGPICWNPRIWMQAMTFGYPIEVDFNPAVTKCLILWGTNPAQSDNSLFWASINDYLKSGGRLICIDPRRSTTASKATLWLHPFPGTDTLLAYALARVIIEDNLCDWDFINNWCHGFDIFKAKAFERSLQDYEKITGVSAEDIKAAAHLWCDFGPGALLSGRGVDQIGLNTAPLHRVLAALRAITGGVDKPGTCSINMAPSFLSEYELEMSDRFPQISKAHGLNEGTSHLQSYTGYKRANERTQILGKTLPMRYLTSPLPLHVWNAAITGKPYKVSALIVNAANPLLTYADTRLVYEAMQAMDLIVVLDYMITPTGIMADYILPAASAIERPAFQAMGGVSDFCYGGPAAIKPLYERKEDYEIFRELGLAIGQSTDAWPAKNLTEELTRVLQPTGMSWESFKTHGIAGSSTHYYKYAEIDPETGHSRGFATPSGKVELANEMFEDMGAGLVADWFEVPGIHMEVSKDPNHVTLITGARKQPYWASCYFEVESFRTAHPKPLVDMSQNTAKRLELQEGDACLISRLDEPSIEVLQYVHIADIVDGVVSAEYGWWYPEKCKSSKDFEACFESNINYLTRGYVDTDPEPLIGTWIYNGIPCRIRKKE